MPPVAAKRPMAPKRKNLKRPVRPILNGLPTGRPLPRRPVMSSPSIVRPTGAKRKSLKRGNRLMPVLRR
jgi:hypothetical protein